MDLPMDSSLPSTDSQSVTPLTNCQIRDLASSLSCNPTEITSPANEIQNKGASHLSDCALSNCPSRENVSDVGHFPSVKPASPSSGLTTCFSLHPEAKVNKEPVPTILDCDIQDRRISDLGYISTTERTFPLFVESPHISRSLISTPSQSLSGVPKEAFSEFSEHESLLSNLLSKDCGPMPLVSNSLMGQSLTESVPQQGSSLTLDSKATDLFRSLSELSDSSIETDDVTEPISDLYIFESGTQEFILNPQKLDLDLEKINCTDCLSSSSSSQYEDKETGPEHGMHALILGHQDLAVAVTQDHRHISERGESVMVDLNPELGQQGTGPPASVSYEGGLLSISEQSQGKSEVSSLTSPERQSDSPNELWLDACQFLAGEDKDHGDDAIVEGGVWTTIDCFPQGDTKVSGYPGEACGIGWSSDDIECWGAPVQRWSSVDSWASALSDWTAIIAAPPEDFTAAFTEIGAEIDALTQALTETHIDQQTETQSQAETQQGKLSKGQGREQSQNQSHMAIQNQILEPQPQPQSSILPGQTCCSSSIVEPTAAGGSVESYLSATAQGDNKPGELQNTQDEGCLCPTDKRLSVGSCSGMLESSGRYSVDMPAVALITRPGPSSSAAFDVLGADLPLLEEYASAMKANIYTSHKEDPILLHITEDADEGLESQNVFSQLNVGESFRDGLCKVTAQHGVSQRGVVVGRKGDERSYGSSVTGSHYGCTEAKTPKVESGCAEVNTPLNTQPLTDTHMPPVDTPTAQNTNVHTPVFDTSQGFQEAHQGELQSGRSQFIMPVAPLSIGPSIFRPTSYVLEGGQARAKGFLDDSKGHACAHIQPHVLWPNRGGSNNEPPLERHKEKLLTELKVCSDYYRNTGSIHFSSYSNNCEEDREPINFVTVPGTQLLVSEKDRLAYVTLDLDDLFASRITKPRATRLQVDQDTDSSGSEFYKSSKMPHKSHKSTSECKTRSKKDKSGGYVHHASQVQLENVPHHLPAQQTSKTHENHLTGLEDDKAPSVTVIEPVAVAEKFTTKPHGKKKKKHIQNATVIKSEVQPLSELENGAKQKTAKSKIDIFEAKMGDKAGRSKDKSTSITSKDSDKSDDIQKKAHQLETNANLEAEPSSCVSPKDHQPTKSTSQLNEDAIKRRRLSENKFGKMVSTMESKLSKPEGPVKAKREEPKAGVETTRRKAYSDVVKQKAHTPKEGPKVVQPIQAVSVSEDPQSLGLWCQFSAVFTDHAVTWSRDGTVLAEIKRSAGDESRVSVTIAKASHKDLGKYQCHLSSPHGSVTLDYLLTYEVLSEIVIPSPSKNRQSVPVELVGAEEEDVNCSRLIFKEDFLTEQSFAENQPASIVTEKLHFGEGMHRKAFRARLQAGMAPLLTPGDSCVLKVHNSITYGTNNNEEVVLKNFNLAVEECQVQNTAREYIKAYTAVAESNEAFGDVPEIIPIYLVHRPSNDIPYATLEEELIGDFVKYSVRDGKEINLLRRDSEAGQKCCAFQHWVYEKTEGSLLVTDMQGVGMRLTDVGIATSKKGYKGFRGNCATSFIDQFQALHLCNKFCEILGLESLQPKPKKPPTPKSLPKPKPQPSAAPKKKPFGPSVKGKS